MIKEQKKKRFYKEGQIVWSVDLKRQVEVKSIDRDNLKITVLENKDGEIVEHTFPLWSVDVLKYSAKEKLTKTKKDTDSEKMVELLSLIHKIFYPKVFFAKVRETAIIPSKRKEDAGYDIYANLEDYKTGETLLNGEDLMRIVCPVLATTLVPTGLATAMPDTHYLNLKHERGSTAVQSMGVLAGVVDSGFRNEMFIALTPLNKKVIITNAVTSVVDGGDIILYPYSKAIAQGTIDLVPDAEILEITYEELQNIESERGMTMLGQSGK